MDEKETIQYPLAIEAIPPATIGEYCHRYPTRIGDRLLSNRDIYVTEPNKTSSAYGGLTVADRLIIYDDRRIKPTGFEFGIKVHPPEWSESLTGGYAIHTAAMITAMLVNQETFPGSTVVDYGSGIGILSVVALAFGASKVIMYEMNPKAVKEIGELLRLNEIPLERVEIIQDDLKNATIHTRILSMADVGIANIGKWPQYGNAFKFAVEATSLSPKMKYYFAGGNPFPTFLTLPGWNNYLRERSPSYEEIQKLLDEKGFRTHSRIDAIHENFSDGSRVLVASK